ncbi:amino acid adenylation domain-containing protein/thioester reductase-like protein [Aneurinibacillus soli]|uniref:Linear gramicidin synthase subunit D n=1 Tax=Aneurinibacillus soli TaxID=1500254 RepID=A0A0U4WJN0_9BACL|nr:non-ribosomal peptide synthetase [Aneurinibacillus soli]PYE62067.1 amino acid adenylation domain-containing protein/thioester reductase-like protein [Aneurinibacillus soli]BAU28745.1 Linear gramicidin synthase subunit D [Aneurinibacillus soli]
MEEYRQEKAAEGYWFDRLAEPLPVIQIPSDFSRYSLHDAAKESVKASITGPWIQKARTLCQNSNREIDVIMLSAYLVWIYRLSYEEDILVGVPSFCEGEEEEMRILPLRISVAGMETFEQLLTEVKIRLSEAIDHRFFLGAFEASHYPAIFTMGDACREQSVPIIWNIHSLSNGYGVEVTFNSKAFKRETIYRFIEQYQNILETLAAQPSAHFRKIDILSQEECNLYEMLNDTKREFPADKTLPALFVEAAEKFPARIALSSEKGQLTYEELHHKSDQVAQMLCDHGLKKGDFVALFMERSLETVVGLLGIMKAGGVYVPIDPEYPLARIEYMIEDSRAAFIITKTQYTNILQESSCFDGHTAQVLYVDDAALLPYNPIHFSIYPEAVDPAYMIYTSGSTGHPKGTVILHRGAVNLLVYLRGPYECMPDDVFLQFASYSFDASIAETFSALLWGARLHLLSNVERMAIEEFANAAERVKATGALALPTAFFKQIAAYLEDKSIRKLQTIKRIIVAGEALTGETVRLWQRRFGLGSKVFNAYGPTECTVGTTIYLIEEEVPSDQVYIPIGKPYDNYETYIVDPNGQLCPIHVPGELYIGGVGLAKEYLNKPDKTAEAFVPHLFSDSSGKYLYKSGDIVRLLADGNIEYVGRKDNQVKIRGHRIEIDEIEDVFAKQADVEHVAVVAKTEEDGNKRLVTYYSTGSMQPLDEKKIRNFLAQSLPGYMVPEQFIYLENMPIAPTGKIDRKLLVTRKDKITLIQKNREKPKSETEKCIAKAWEKVLGVEEIGVADDFFDIGGHSLKIISILVLLKPKFPSLKIQDFFRCRTIAALAEYVERAGESEPVHALSNEERQIKELTEPPVIKGAKKREWNTARNVLVTGGTGYLGAHIVHELLQETKANVYCLVRVSDGGSPEQRLLNTVHFYFPDSNLEAFKSRIVIVEGDLSEPDLGISPDVRDHLSEKIDAIIHCAADVRHFGDSSQFEKVNVRGTSSLLDIIRNKQDAHFHHISTVSVPEDLAASGQWNDFVKNGDFTYDVVLENEYSNSKLRAENIVRTAMKGIPATIYRVGNLVGRTQSGKFQRNIESNAFYRMIKAMLLLGIAPAADWYVDITPVDYASRAIVNLASQPEIEGRTFHICNSEQIHYTDFITQLQSLGYEITLLEPTRYREALFQVDDPGEKAEALELAIAQLEGDGAHDSEYRYVCNEAQEILMRAGIDCPKPDHDLVQALVTYAIKIGYFPPAREHVTAR